MTHRHKGETIPEALVTFLIVVLGVTLIGSMTLLSSGISEKAVAKEIALTEDEQTLNDYLSCTSEEEREEMLAENADGETSVRLTVKNASGTTVTSYNVPAYLAKVSGLLAFEPEM